MGIQRSDDGVTTDWPLNERQFTAAGRQVKIRKVRELNMAASTHHRIPLLGVRSKRHRLTRPPAIQHLDAPYCIASRFSLGSARTHARWPAASRTFRDGRLRLLDWLVLGTACGRDWNRYRLRRRGRLYSHLRPTSITICSRKYTARVRPLTNQPHLRYLHISAMLVNARPSRFELGRVIQWALNSASPNKWTFN